MGFRCIVTVGFIPQRGTTHVVPINRDRERANLFESPWWNQSLPILTRQGYTSWGTT
jgi:hypothetical protein